MNQVQGTIRKMRVTPTAPISYRLPVGDTEVDLSPYLGSTVALEYSGKIFCIECGHRTKKSFNQGHCFRCLRRLASCDMCIVKPEQCHYHLGTCREPQWGEQHCMQAHVVYLANSSGLKVGITRGSQVPTRWIDQGATQALPVFEVKTRYHAGLIEVAMKDFVGDRTDWRRMLKGEPEILDLIAERTRLLQAARMSLSAEGIPSSAQGVRLLDNACPVHFSYPVLTYPDKVRAHNFDKKAQVEGTLLGIKGQYLILDNGVLNVRKFAGYEICLTRG